MTGQETDLFGVPVASLAPRSRTSAVNDMELVCETLRVAMDVKLVLVGTAERVHRYVDRESVEPVSASVDAMTHQLIEAKWLEVGGTHHVRYGRYQGPARSVLVPRRSRDAVHRWSALSALRTQQGKGVA